MSLRVSLASFLTVFPPFHTRHLGSDSSLFFSAVRGAQSGRQISPCAGAAGFTPERAGQCYESICSFGPAGSQHWTILPFTLRCSTGAFEMQEQIHAMTDVLYKRGLRARAASFPSAKPCPRVQPWTSPAAMCGCMRVSSSSIAVHGISH